MNLIVIAGLTLNVLRSLIFIVDSVTLSGLMAKMVKHLAEDHGHLDSTKISKEVISNRSKQINRSKRRTIAGFVLFLVGFGIQIISEVF